jgi:glycerate 2-kinase
VIKSPTRALGAGNGAAAVHGLQKGVDVVITGGEVGRPFLPGQGPLRGAPGGDPPRGIPTIAVCGTSDLGPGRRRPDFAAVHTLTGLEPDLPTAIAHAEPLLVRLASTIPFPVSG